MSRRAGVLLALRWPIALAAGELLRFRAGVTLDPLESPALRRHPGQLERL